MGTSVAGASQSSPNGEHRRRRQHPRAEDTDRTRYGLCKMKHPGTHPSPASPGDLRSASDVGTVQHWFRCWLRRFVSNESDSECFTGFNSSPDNRQTGSVRRQDPGPWLRRMMRRHIFARIVVCDVLRWLGAPPPSRACSSRSRSAPAPACCDNKPGALVSIAGTTGPWFRNSRAPGIITGSPLRTPC